MDAREVQLIKEKHLGLNKERKKVNRPGDKFKQVFSDTWDAADDTSRDAFSLYSNRNAPILLHGKGFVGGVDREFQSK
jgi:ATP-dependent RNA helicase DDX23/PRP28